MDTNGGCRVTRGSIPTEKGHPKERIGIVIEFHQREVGIHIPGSMDRTRVEVLKQNAVTGCAAGGAAGRATDGIFVVLERDERGIIDGRQATMIGRHEVRGSVLRCVVDEETGAESDAIDGY